MNRAAMRLNLLPGVESSCDYLAEGASVLDVSFDSSVIADSLDEPANYAILMGYVCSCLSGADLYVLVAEPSSGSIANSVAAELRDRQLEHARRVGRQTHHLCESDEPSSILHPALGAGEEADCCYGYTSARALLWHRSDVSDESRR